MTKEEIMKQYKKDVETLENAMKAIEKKEKIKHAVDILKECAEIIYQESKETERSPEMQVWATIGVLKEEIKRMEGKIELEEDNHGRK